MFVHPLFHPLRQQRRLWLRRQLLRPRSRLANGDGGAAAMARLPSLPRQDAAPRRHEAARPAKWIRRRQRLTGAAPDRSFCVAPRRRRCRPPNSGAVSRQREAQHGAHSCGPAKPRHGGVTRHRVAPPPRLRTEAWRAPGAAGPAFPMEHRPQATVSSDDANGRVAKSCASPQRQLLRRGSVRPRLALRHQQLSYAGGGSKSERGERPWIRWI